MKIQKKKTQNIAVKACDEVCTPVVQETLNDVQPNYVESAKQSIRQAIDDLTNVAPSCDKSKAAIADLAVVLFELD